MKTATELLLLEEMERQIVLTGKFISESIVVAKHLIEASEHTLAFTPPSILNAARAVIEISKRMNEI